VELHNLRIEILNKLRITIIQRIKKNGGWKSSKNSMTGYQFQRKYCPVINDASFRIMLNSKLISGLEASIIDIETKFLMDN
jgi:hypothetical protein